MSRFALFVNFVFSENYATTKFTKKNTKLYGWEIENLQAPIRYSL